MGELDYSALTHLPGVLSVARTPPPPSKGSPMARPTTEPAEPGQVGRRRFLTYLVAAPTLTVATKLTTDAVAPATAEAVIPTLPQPAEILDLGDVLPLARTELLFNQLTGGSNTMRSLYDPVRATAATARARLVAAAGARWGADAS